MSSDTGLPSPFTVSPVATEPMPGERLRGPDFERPAAPGTPARGADGATPAREPGDGSPGPGDVGEAAGSRPRWARPALVALLVATAALYLWGLGASGWANAFYSAAAQAGSQSWKAFFYASSDAGNSITVDKTPASIWVMALSVRVFGLSSWSLLVPQALIGVGSVALLYATVRRSLARAGGPLAGRSAGEAAGLLAGLVLATTPVAALMFRFNNPDALLVLLLIGSVWATLRATEPDVAPRVAVRWLVIGGTFVGFAFLTKMLQAFLVLPALALVYLVAAAAPWGRRLLHLLVALAAVLVSGGWWVAVVELVPESWRPYIGGSQTNSVLDLMFGYNGLGRLNGDETGSVGGGRGWGDTGAGRLFGGDLGGQAAWLIPAALVLLVAGLVLTARRPRTDPARAGYLVWGLWLAVTAVTFSLMQGIFHAYYTVALAPAVGALVGLGSVQLWRARRRFLARATMAGTVALTAWWSWVLLGRSPQFLPWLAGTVLIAGLATAVLLLGSDRIGRRVAAVVAAAAVLVGVAGPTAYAVQTASEPHTGSIPTAGPSVSDGGRGGFGGGPVGGGPGRGGFSPPGQTQQGGPGGGFGGGRQGQTQQGGPGGGFGGGRQGQTQQGQQGQQGQTQQGQTRQGRGGVGGGGTGGLLGASEPSDELVRLLGEDADAYTWVAAAVGSNTAAGYQLATQEPVMPVGGFNGSDPSPTLEQFQQDVAQGRIHWFIGGGGFGQQMGGSDAAQQIASWVAQNFTATTVDGVTLYDLTSGTGSSASGTTT